MYSFFCFWPGPLSRAPIKPGPGARLSAAQKDFFSLFAWPSGGPCAGLHQGDEKIVEDREPSLSNVSEVMDGGDVEGGFLDTTTIHSNHTTLEEEVDVQPRKRQRIEASGSGLTSVLVSNMFTA